MSLIIHLDQYTKKLNRMKYIDNNISEIIESHGSTWLETEKEMLKNDPYSVHPFYILPMGWNQGMTKDDRKYIYNEAKTDLEHVIIDHDFGHLYENLSESNKVEPITRFNSMFNYYDKDFNLHGKKKQIGLANGYAIIYGDD